MVKTVLVKDVFDTYSYFYIDDKTGHGFLIDPGAEADKLLQIIQVNDWTIERILLTHGHFDHTGAVEKLANTLQIPYCIHEQGKKYLESTHYNLSQYCSRNVVLRNAETFADKERIHLSANPEFSLQVLHTPGHTEDSCIFYSEKDHLAFVGDTIFAGSIGNTGYPGGNMRDLQRSIVNTIFQLPQDIVLYSGHSEQTTVGTEIRRYQ